MAVKLRGGRYYYEFQHNGVKYRRVCAGCRTEAAAKRLEEFVRAKVLVDPDMPRRKAPMLSEFSKSFLTHIDKRIEAGSLKPATRMSYQHGCQLLAATKLWKLRINEITRPRAAELVFPGTGWNANHALRTLRAMLGYAEETNVIRTAPRIELRSVEGRERLFAPWEEELVLKHASPVLSDILAIIFNCGLRPQSEACCLRWEDINWTESRILIQRGKSKQARRYVGITERMRAVLENARARNARRGKANSPYVFPSPRSAGGHVAWLAAMWRETLKRIAAEGIVLAPGLVPYSARHTYATNFLAGGGDIGQLARLMGHSDISTTLRYVHMIEASASAKVMDGHNDSKLKLVKKRA